jgi:hypothetical protein
MSKSKSDFILLLLFVAIGLSTSVIADTTITWQVFSGGGTKAVDTSYVLKGTLRQTAVRVNTNSGYQNQSGFWGYIRSLGPCCIGIRGNCNGDLFENLNTLDHTFLINYIFRMGPVSSCLQEGDANGDGNGPNVLDLNYLTNYFYHTPPGPPPPACP